MRRRHQLDVDGLMIEEECVFHLAEIKIFYSRMIKFFLTSTSASSSLSDIFGNDHYSIFNF